MDWLVWQSIILEQLKQMISYLLLEKKQGKII